MCCSYHNKICYETNREPIKVKIYCTCVNIDAIRIIFFVLDLLHAFVEFKWKRNSIFFISDLMKNRRLYTIRWMITFKVKETIVFVSKSIVSFQMLRKTFLHIHSQISIWFFFYFCLQHIQQLMGRTHWMICNICVCVPNANENLFYWSYSN